MKHLVPMIAVFAGVLLLAAAGIAQEDDMARDQQKMMEDWMKMMAPGEHHAKLDYFAGEWNVTAKMWMAGPDSEPQVYPDGTATYSWVLGKRFLEGTVESPMGNGQSYKGLGYIGYDNFRKQYVSMSMSNMQTNFHVGHGNYIEDENIFLFFNTMDEPMTGEIGKTSTQVFQMKNENEFTVKVTDPIFGMKDNVVAEFTYKRK